MQEFISDDVAARELGFTDELMRQEYVALLVTTLDDFIRAMYRSNSEQADLKVQRIVSKLGEVAGFSESEIPQRITVLGIPLKGDASVYPDTALTSLFGRQNSESLLFLWVNMQNTSLEGLVSVSNVMIDGYRKW
jgi:hypothetical protein